MPSLIKKLGFTLAEVLITLGIIGVVAAMTIPTLLNGTNDEEFRSATKEAYSMLNQALMTANNNGELDLTSTATLVTSLSNVLKIVNKDLTSSSLLYNGDYKTYKGSTTYTYYNLTSPTFSLNNSAVVQVSGINSTCTGASTWGNALVRNKYCASINIDTNGTKGPNMMGKDFVAFWMVKDNNVYKLIPTGFEGSMTCVNGSVDSNTSWGCTAYYINGQALP